MAETIVSKVQRGAKLESRGAKHPLAPPQIRLWIQCNTFKAKAPSKASFRVCVCVRVCKECIKYIHMSVILIL